MSSYTKVLLALAAATVLMFGTLIVYDFGWQRGASAAKRDAVKAGAAVWGWDKDGAPLLLWQGVVPMKAPLHDTKEIE